MIMIAPSMRYILDTPGYHTASTPRQYRAAAWDRDSLGEPSACPPAHELRPVGLHDVGSSCLPPSLEACSRRCVASVVRVEAMRFSGISLRRVPSAVVLKIPTHACTPSVTLCPSRIRRVPHEVFPDACLLIVTAHGVIPSPRSSGLACQIESSGEGYAARVRSALPLAQHTDHAHETLGDHPQNRAAWF